VYEGALVAQNGVRADEVLIGDVTSENFDLENVVDDLLGFLVDVGVDESHVVVACDDVAQRRQTLLDALDYDGVRE
jgi:hypothetical protein